MQMRTINRYIAARCRDPLHMLEVGLGFHYCLRKMDDFGKQSQRQQNNPDHEHWQAGQKTGGASLKQR